MHADTRPGYTLTRADRLAIKAKAIKSEFGPRCPDYDADCVVCRAWLKYDKAKAIK